MTFEELYEIAKKTLGVRKTSRNTEVGNVACALETIDGNVYTGINIDTACSMGFCAEANAIGSMLTNGESKDIFAENQSTYIPLGSIHRLKNPGRVPLIIIEIQSGSYLSEDDIVRIEDKYGRLQYS